MTIYRLTETCSVAGQIQPGDVAALSRTGFGTIICNRPDDEDPGQPGAAEIGAECEKLGVAFHHLPVSDAGISPEMVVAFQKAVKESDGQVLAYCRSGHRSSVLWQYSGSP